MKLQKHSVRFLECSIFLCLTLIIVSNVSGLSYAPSESEEIPVNPWEHQLIHEEDSSDDRKSFGETCSYRFKCKVSENLACKNGSCACSSPSMIYEAVDSSETSYTTTHRWRYGRRNGCVMKAGQKCKFSVITDDENGRGLFERIACVQNSRCDRYGFCACKQNFYDSVNGTCEQLKSFGDECSYDAQCSESAGLSCIANVCDCDPATAVYSSYMDKCLGLVGSACTDSSECMTGAECYSQKCVCTSGFFETVNKKCTPMIPLGGICTSDSQCLKDSFTQKSLKCVKGTCDCDPSTSVYTETYLVSEPERVSFCAPKVDQPCIVEMCAPNLICDDSGVCQCRPGLVKSQSGLNCVKDLGGSCNATADCAQDLTCNEGQCSCRYEEQEYVDHQCRSPVEGPCTSDDNCDVNAFCNFETSRDLVGHCTCKPGYVEGTRGFCKTDFNGTCYSPKECDDVANLRCISNLCQCPSHSKYNLEKRQCLKRVGGQCNHVDECISGTICNKAHLKVPGKCACKEGHVETEEYACVIETLQNLEVKDGLAPALSIAQEY